MSNTNEGTPVFGVEASETRAVTLSVARTVIGGDKATAAEVCEAFMARAWRDLGEARGIWGSVTVSADLPTGPGNVPLTLAQRCESFISGFEDDELQEGIPALLADLRAVTAGTYSPADARAPEMARAVSIRNTTNAAGKPYTEVRVCMADLHLTCDLVNDRQIRLVDSLARSHGVSLDCDEANAARVADVLRQPIESFSPVNPAHVNRAAPPVAWTPPVPGCQPEPDDEGAPVWHLFRIEAEDEDGTHAFIVSAESGSESKAQELAEAAVLEVIGTDDEPAAVSHCSRLGGTDSDVFERIGLLAD